MRQNNDKKNKFEKEKNFFLKNKNFLKNRNKKEYNIYIRFGN
jgi:hypothetical protein